MKNDGSSLHPWASLAEIIKSNTLESGDTLLLLNGFHGELIKLAGDYKVPITIISAKDNHPEVLQIVITGSNWIIDGITFTQEGNSGKGTPRFYDNGVFLVMDSTSYDNIIQNCIYHSTEDASKWTIKDWRENVWSAIRDFGNSNIIRNNHLENIAYGIELSEVCNNSLVENNFISNFSGDGIRIGGADSCIVQYNTIKNAVELDSNQTAGNHEDAIQAWVGKVNDDAVYNLVIRSNYLQSYEDINQKFIARGMQGIGLFDGPYKNLLIENNVVIIEHWHGISVFGAYNSKIINNTVLPIPGTSEYIYGPPWIGIFSHKNGTPSKDNIIRNNLACNMVIKENGASADHNLIDPAAFKFVNDFNYFDFTPKPNYEYGGNYIINNGNPDGAPKVDFYGVQRPQGNGYDIGAFELKFENK